MGNSLQTGSKADSAARLSGVLLALAFGLAVPHQAFAQQAPACDPVFTNNPVNVAGIGNAASTRTTDTAGNAIVDTTFGAITRIGNPATNGGVNRLGPAGGTLRYEQAPSGITNDGLQYSTTFARAVPITIAAGPTYGGPPSNMDDGVGDGVQQGDDEVTFTAVGASPGFAWIVDPVIDGTFVVSNGGLTVSFRGLLQTNPRRFAQFRLRTPAGATMTGVDTRWRSVQSPGFNSAQHNITVPACRPVIQFEKRVTNDNGRAATVADFNITSSAGALTFGANTGTAQNAVYTSNRLTVNAGTYTMNEINHPQYTEGTWSCTGAGTTQGGAAFNAGSVALVNGAVATCSITNNDNVPVADLTITKSNTFTPAQPSDLGGDTVIAGASTTYTLVVTNIGPDVVTGPVVRDAPGAGITCPVGNPVTITGDGVPAGSFNIGHLTSAAGITLGALNAGQSTTLSFTCTVN